MSLEIVYELLFSWQFLVVTLIFLILFPLVYLLSSFEFVKHRKKGDKSGVIVEETDGKKKKGIIDNGEEIEIIENPSELLPPSEQRV